MLRKWRFQQNCLNLKKKYKLNMSNFDLNENQRFEKVDKEILDNELFSLKLTDSLYKKDIGKFLEYLSSYFI